MDGQSLRWAKGQLGRWDGDLASLDRLLESLAPVLGLENPKSELVLDPHSLTPDALGMHHLRFFREHHGVPVVESDLVLHFRPDGVLQSINGHYPPTLPLPPLHFSPNWQKLEAQALKEAHILLRQRGEQPDVLPEIRSRLVLWPSPARYALEVELGFELHQRWFFYVDAFRGHLLATRSQVKHNQHASGSGLDSYGKTRSLNLSYNAQQGLYSTVDRSGGSQGALITTQSANYSQSLNGTVITSSNTTISDAAAVDVHANLRLVHDFFQDEYGRNSWNGRGANVRALVHYGYQYANAFWTNGVMAFGDGDGNSLLKLHRCLDIAAHEFSHGVVDGTAGLVYENQSGALNEHYADVFAALIDDANWTIGEDCVSPRYGSVLRDMGNPARTGQPAHMSQYRRLPNTEEGDWGGVHINSGIVNKAAYLVGQSLGRERLGKIWYRSLAQGYLNRRSDFVDLRRGTLQACEDLYNAQNCAFVSDAFEQVGIEDPSSDNSGQCPPNSSPSQGKCYCDEGYQLNQSRTGCEPIPSQNCPPNSSQHGDACYCNDGYEVDSSGQSCVPAGRGCPENSHRSGRVCVCDEGYQGSPQQGYGCEPIENECPPHSEPASDPRYCQCIEGWVVNSSRTACVPGNSGCGNENYYGRCFGEELIYCYQNKIQIIDCAQSGRSCGLQDTDSGNNCLEIEEPDSCEGLDIRGECQGNTLRLCYEGELLEYPCGDAACVWIDEEYGATCDPCPENSAYFEGDCYCLEGFEPNAAQDACVSSGSNSGGDPAEDNRGDSSDGSSSGQSGEGSVEEEFESFGGEFDDGRWMGESAGGCSCSSGDAPLALLTLLPLLWSRRRSLRRRKFPLPA